MGVNGYINISKTLIKPLSPKDICNIPTLYNFSQKETIFLHTNLWLMKKFLDLDENQQKRVKKGKGCITIWFSDIPGAITSPYFNNDRFLKDKFIKEHIWFTKPFIEKGWRIDIKRGSSFQLIGISFRILDYKEIINKKVNIFELMDI